MPDFSLSDTPWLAPTKSPAEFLLQGASVGSGIAANRNQRASLMQRRMEFEREQQTRDTILPIEMQFKRQQIQTQALAIEDTLKNRQDALENASSLMKMRDLVNPDLSSGKVEDAYLKVLQFGSNNVKVLNDPRYKNFVDYIGELNKAKETTNYRKKVVEEQIERTKLEQFQTIERIGREKTDRVSPFKQLINERNDAFTAGDKESVALFDAKLQKEVQSTGLQIKTNPDGSVEVFQGPQKPTGGAASKVAERLSQTQKGLEELNSLQSSLRPEDVGIKGVIGENVFDRILPQFGIPSSDVARMDNRTKLKTLAEGLMRQVSADSRFSNADREAIKQILPSPGVVESFESSQQTINTLRKIFSKRALIDAKEGAMQPPKWALDNLDDQSLIEAAKTKLLTEDEALEAFRARKRR